MNPTWVTAFLDLTADEHDEAVAFFRAVSGYGLSASRGEHDEFATLVPDDGDAFLRVQRIEAGESHVHLDLHLAGHALDVRRSPGGLPYCIVGEPGARRPQPARWPGGHRSIIDQVCIDIPAAGYDEECAFWADLTGWEAATTDVPEFRRLVRPPGIAIRILLQRLDEEDGPVRAHLDLATDDRPAEVARHQELGAGVLRVHEQWTVMQPPAGPVYCITDRDPAG